ncbi:MAG TPA: SRPBCC family protein [Candidatus Cybelea sp.]|nr:SRPBCC family protein [Candidatus Cybelea sp.]
MNRLDLWSWDGKIDRGTYALVGLTAFAVKHNLDRLLARAFHRPWSLFNYWIPVGRAVRITSLGSSDRAFLFWMCMLSLPFIWVGVVLTLRRLRAMGLPLWLVALFFAPYLNLLFFLLLCIYPSQDAGEASRAGRQPGGRRMDRIIPDSLWGSAAVAVLISSLLGVAGTLLGVNTRLAVYGVGLFVALPFCLGLLSALLHGYHQSRTLPSCLLVAVLSIGLLGLLLLALAVEGLICLLMAAPIALLLGLLGGTVGYYIQRRRGSHFETQATLGVVLLFVPLLLGAEGLRPAQPPLLEVRTQIEINAPPETVWRFLSSFPTLPRPTEWPFRVGIAYPLRSTLAGSGIGARRECEFSTGDFVEPIRVWEPNHRLAFEISGEPPVMQEMSPYGHIHTRHIDGQYFHPRDAEFVLTLLRNGHTLLTGTSHYENRMWPVAYWRLWSDEIVHDIHRRVFRQIKRLSEASYMEDVAERGEKP